MPATPSKQNPLSSEASLETPLEMAKAIRADAFDHFIDEQLRKDYLDGEPSDSEVVCHVY